MSDATDELWAARDSDGTLWVFHLEPECVDGDWAWCDEDVYLSCMDGDLLPSLQPGQKCRLVMQRA